VDLEGVVADPGEDALAAPQELLAGRGVAGEGGPGEKEAALPVQGLDVERRHGTAGGAEEHHVASGMQAVEAVAEGALAYAVVDDVDALAAGDAPRLLYEVLLGVDDHLVGSCVLREPGLLFAAGGPDDGGTPHLGHLAEQEPHAAGRRVH
jgi:hypothetical protein